MEYKKTHQKWLDAQPAINSGRIKITEKGVTILKISKVFKIVRK